MMIFRRKKRMFLIAAALVGGIALLGTLSCTNFGYYASCTKGQYSLISQRRLITALIREPGIAPDLKGQLETVLRIREFATRELGLPENGSYRSYVDLKRPYVVWNVVATPEFNLQPRQWCFPVAGCVSYRGFFSEEDATAFAKMLKRKGDDVYLYGVTAYSTLGWFDDPVLNTFFTRSEEDLAGLIFHELAHQKLYVKNDSVFNESFAKAIELEGVTRWLAANGESGRTEAYFQGKERGEEFTLLVMEFQDRLREVYSKPFDEATKRQEKAALFQGLRDAYAGLRESWSGYRGYDRWFAELNNAKIASVSTYNTYVPAFSALLQQRKGNLDAFYREVERIGRLPRERRVARLTHLTGIRIASLPAVRQPAPDGAPRGKAL